jgi:trans-aconitate methyltransferase
VNELDILAKFYGTDKQTNEPGQTIYHSYTPIYHQLLKDHIFEYENVLEIGVWDGRSHLMWKDYFPNAMIYGIDNTPEYQTDKRLDNIRIKIIIGDQAYKELLDKNFTKEQLDLIIDDGSHFSWHQQKSFYYLWDKLKFGGFYFIEDLSVSTMRQYREVEDWISSTVGWLETMNTNHPQSYYIQSSDLARIRNEIEYIKIEGELAIIKKVSK